MEKVYNIYSNGELFNYLATYTISFLNGITGNFESYEFYYNSLFVLFLAGFLVYKMARYPEKGISHLFDMQNGLLNNVIFSGFLFTTIIYFLFMPVKSQFVTLVPNEDPSINTPQYTQAVASHLIGESIYDSDRTFKLPFIMSFIYAIPGRVIQGIPIYHEGVMTQDQKQNVSNFSLYGLLNNFVDGKMIEQNMFDSFKYYNKYAELYREESSNVKNLDNSMNYLLKFQTLFNLSVYQEYLKEAYTYKHNKFSEDLLYKSGLTDLESQNQSVKELKDRDFSLLQTIMFNTDTGKHVNELAEYMSNGTTERDLQITFNHLFPAIIQLKFLSDHAIMLDSSDFSEKLYDFTDKLLAGEDISNDDFFKLIKMEAGALGSDRIAYSDFFENVMTPFDSTTITSIKEKYYNYLQNFSARTKMLSMKKADLRSKQIRNDFLLNTFTNLVLDTSGYYYSTDFSGLEEDFAHCLNKQGTLDPVIKNNCDKFTFMLQDREWFKNQRFNESEQMKHLTDKIDSSEHIDMDYGLPTIKTPINGFNNLKPIITIEDNMDNFNTLLSISYNSFRSRESDFDFMNNLYKPLTDSMFLEFVLLDKDSDIYKSFFEKKDQGSLNYLSENDLKSSMFKLSGICDTTTCPTNQFDYFKFDFTDIDSYTGLERIIDLNADNKMDFEFKKLDYMISVLKKLEQIKRDRLINSKSRTDIKVYLKYRAAINLLESYKDFFNMFNISNSTTELKLTSFDQYRKYINVIELTNIYMKDSLTFEFQTTGNRIIPSDFINPLDFTTALMYKPLLITAIFDSISYLEFKDSANIQEDFKKIFKQFYPKSQQDFILRFGYVKKSEKLEDSSNIDLWYSSTQEYNSNFYNETADNLENQAFLNFIKNLHNVKKKEEKDSSSFDIVDIPSKVNALNNALVSVLDLTTKPFVFTNKMNFILDKDSNLVITRGNLTSNYLGSISKFHNNPFENFIPPGYSDFGYVFTPNSAIELASASSKDSMFYASAFSNINLDYLNNIIDLSSFKDRVIIKDSPENIVEIFSLTNSMSKNNSVEDLKMLKSGLNDSLVNKDYTIMAIYYSAEALTYFIPLSGGAKALKLASKSSKIINSAKRATKLLEESKVMNFAKRGLVKGKKLTRDLKALKIKKLKRLKKSKLISKAKGFGAAGTFKYLMSKIKDILLKALSIFGSILFAIAAFYIFGLAQVLMFFWNNIVIPLVYHKIKLLIVFSSVLFTFFKTLFTRGSSNSINDIFYLSIVSELKTVAMLSLLFTLFVFTFILFMQIAFNTALEISLPSFISSEIMFNGYLSLFLMAIVFRLMLFIIKLFKLQQITEDLSFKNLLKKKFKS